MHGGLVDIDRFEGFIGLLQAKLREQNLDYCWPSLFVAQIGTDLHTTSFKPDVARRLYSILAPLGSLAKGHYTDWVENPADYPATGMGAANVGPEFTAEEFMVLGELENRERLIIDQLKLRPSNFMSILQKAVIESERWKKWLLPGEEGIPFHELLAARKDWLLMTGSRYIWTNEDVTSARLILYSNLREVMVDPHSIVVDRITLAIEKYIVAFNLQNSITTLGE